MSKSKDIQEPVFYLDEMVPMERIIELFKSDRINKMKGNDKTINDWNVRDMATLVELYQQNGGIRRYYKYGKNDTDKEGLYYTKHGLGLQWLSTDIRGYLCQNDYIDLDIENCHPTILVEIMKREGEEYNFIQEYLDNKDEWRKQYPDIKKMINIQINNPNTKLSTSWFNANRALTQIYNFIVAYKESGKDIHKEITKIQVGYMDTITKIANKMKIRINASIFDGIIVSKCDQIDEFVSKINQAIHPCKIVHKPWKIPELSIVNTQKFDYSDNTNFADLLDLSGKHYPSIEHFYIDALPLLIKTTRILTNGNIITKSEFSSFKNCFELHKNYKKFMFSVSIGDKNKCVSLSNLFTLFGRLILYNSITPLRYNITKKEFSIDCGFICEHDELPVDWEERVIPFKKHILDVNARGNDDIAKGFYHFFANIIQTENKSQTIMVTTGLQGIGKSIIPTMIATKILGSKALIVATLADITGNFNNHLANKRMVLVNEMSNLDSNHKHTDNSVLKNIVDAPTFLMEPKGIDRFEVPNILEFFGCSNHKYCISQSDGMERRNFVIQANSKYKDDTKYFDDLIKYFEDKRNIRSIYEFLRTYDISDKHLLRNLPTTESKAIGIYKSMHPVQKAIMIACLTEQSINGIVSIKRKNLFELMTKYNLVTNDLGKIKMAEYIRDHHADKIKMSNSCNVLKYHIEKDKFKYDEQVWNVIKEQMNEVETTPLLDE